MPNARVLAFLMLVEGCPADVAPSLWCLAEEASFRLYRKSQRSFLHEAVRRAHEETRQKATDRK